MKTTGCLIICFLIVGIAGIFLWQTRTIYDRYEFEVEPQSVAGITVRANFPGDWNRINKHLTNLESPYYLHLIFQQPEQKFDSVEVVEVKLNNSDGTEVFTSAANRVVPFKVYDFPYTKDEHSSARFLYESIVMNHVAHTLRIRFRITDDEEQILELKVNPVFSRQRSNRIWDAIMSV